MAGNGAADFPPPAQRPSILAKLKSVFRRKPPSRKPSRAKPGNINELKAEVEIDDHRIPLNALCRRVRLHETDLGLNKADVEERLHVDGYNELAPPKQTPEWLRFLYNLVRGFGALLLAGMVMSFAAYIADAATNDVPSIDNLYMGFVLLAIVLATGAFQYYQEYNASKVMESFLHMIPQMATVIREGEKFQVQSKELVLGDVVELHGGDLVPADLRIIFAQGLRVDNSSLTGEAEPQQRTAECTSDNPLETRNLAFFSTSVVEGIGRGIVVRCGNYTVMGRIANLAAGIRGAETPMQKEVMTLIIIIGSVASACGIIFGGVVFAQGYDWISAFIFLIAVIVGNVPEGLMAMMTVSLTLTAKRMAAKCCLVKHLQAVETLGSTSVICSDKTGTLTQNRMTVAHLWLGGETTDVIITPGGLQPAINTSRMGGFTELTRVATLCNRAEFMPHQTLRHVLKEEVPIEKRKVVGDASETALLRYVELVIGDTMGKREQHKKVMEIPFNSTNKYQVSIHENPTVDGSSAYLLVMKGAPEKIIERCSTQLVNGEEVPFDDRRMFLFKNEYLELGSMGERVLGFCDLELPAKDFPPGFQFDDEKINFPVEGLRFCGLMSLIDPPRPTVPDAVAKCRSAGIKVIMVTGDHPITAQAIAKAVGIISETPDDAQTISRKISIAGYTPAIRKAKQVTVNSVVVHGQELRDLNPEELDRLISGYSEIVFARTSPQQKLQIVESCQRCGHIVAVTGDGVNDSPALKQADIGVAMGISGSDVSKQAADMILLDDNFATIVTGVEEGRLIFENLKKCICYSCISQVPEFMAVLVFIAIQVPLPLGTFEMMCIDCLTDPGPGISLAYEPPEGDIMKRPPRKVQLGGENRIINYRMLEVIYGQLGLLQAAAAFFTYFVVMADNGFWPNAILFQRKFWDAPGTWGFEDSYGQEWGLAQRKALEGTCQTAYFDTVVLMQWADLITRKGLRGSFVSRNMDNYPMVGALVIETWIAAFLTYCPGLDQGLHLYPLKWQWWCPAIGFAVLFFVYEETRKHLIRKYPNGFFYRETYY